MTDQQGSESLVELLDALRRMVADAKGVPLSASAIIPRDQALELIDHCLAAAPREVVEAREVLAERSQVLERTRQEADQLLQEARRRVESMISDGEIVRAAETSARRIDLQAREQANTLKRQTEDYIDRRLANFEIILSDLLEQARRGRQRLADSSEPATGTPEPDTFFAPPPGDPGVDDEHQGGVSDA